MPERLNENRNQIRKAQAGKGNFLQACQKDWTACWLRRGGIQRNQKHQIKGKTGKGKLLADMPERLDWLRRDETRNAAGYPGKIHARNQRQTQTRKGILRTCRKDWTACWYAGDKNQLPGEKTGTAGKFGLLAAGRKAGTLDCLLHRETNQETPEMFADTGQSWRVNKLILFSLSFQVKINNEWIWIQSLQVGWSFKDEGTSGWSFKDEGVCWFGWRMKF